MRTLYLGLLVFVLVTVVSVHGQDVPTDITQYLLTLLNEEKEVRARLERELTDIGSEIAALQVVENNATCGCPWHTANIAFSASLSNDITNLGAKQQIAFDNVITNLGNGYDARHGEFRAPVTGTYEFSVSMLMNPGHWAGVEIVNDGTPVAKVRAGDSSEWSMASTVVKLALKAGQDVWVEHIDESDSNMIYGQQYSTFSGHLIQP